MSIMRKILLLMIAPFFIIGALIISLLVGEIDGDKDCD